MFLKANLYGDEVKEITTLASSLLGLFFYPQTIRIYVNRDGGGLPEEEWK